eukprot:TRINITY_DN287_c0_g1_i1.p1 TRINITY_DN287_c0_g1~~TRINITY_DN287_c0_g1_i1.p1  ORF type:complete len:287 (+),score=36.70 TRINITY_DN287_c0_g1_i1:29-889(+)
MLKSLGGKVFLVTGATDGIGKAAATEFARRGAFVTLVGRNQTKTAKVLEELKLSTKNDNLDAIVCDLSSMAEVRRAAEEFKAKHDRLDVLVNNVGAIFTPRKGPDGYEITFALNHLSYFQLTVSLLDLIKKTPGARIVSTSSGMQAMGSLDLEKTPYATDGSSMSAYSTSKLANILFTKELQRQLEGTSVVANCFEPGVVQTNIGAFGETDLGWFTNLAFWLSKPFSRTPEQGADSLIWLATSDEAGALKGEHVYDRRVAKPTRQAEDPVLAQKLWELSTTLCQKV